MTVEVQIACAGYPPAAGIPSTDEIAGWAEGALGSEARTLCLRVVDEAESADLNTRFRDREHPTNVLAFPANEPGLLGDIAICAPVVALEARQQDKVLADHYAHLVVHGVLHLLGLDHDTSGNAAVMEAREARVLEGFGVADPYGGET